MILVSMTVRNTCAVTAFEQEAQLRSAKIATKISERILNFLILKTFPFSLSAGKRAFVADVTGLAGCGDLFPYR